MLDHVSLQFAWFCSYKITQSAIQVILKLSRWKKSYVTFFGFHNILFNSVSCLDVFFQICLTLQCFITDIALDCASIFIHVFFHISCCSECSRTSYTLVCLFITHTFCHMTASAVVWNSFLTVFACNFPVRFHVCPQLRPSNTFFSHFSQVRTRSSCFALICTFKCFSEGASILQMAQVGILTFIRSTSAKKFWITDFYSPKQTK